VLICPGWCGEEFVDADTVKNFRALQRHTNRCVKGHASMGLLEKFALWLITEEILPPPDEETEVDDARYAVVLAASFLAEQPPTDPRVMYPARDFAR